MSLLLQSMEYEEASFIYTLGFKRGNQMDKQIRKIEKESKKVGKDLKHLEKADKKRDKACKMGEKMMHSKKRK